MVYTVAFWYSNEHKIMVKVNIVKTKHFAYWKPLKGTCNRTLVKSV